MEAFLAGKPPKVPEDQLGVQALTLQGQTHDIVRSVGSLPENSPARLKAIALARKHALIPDYAVNADLRKTATMDHHLAHARLQFAWGVLQETGIIHDGMRLEELVALLGLPTKIDDDTAEWYYSSGMHVNPVLRYTRSDAQRSKGKVEVTRY